MGPASAPALPFLMEALEQRCEDAVTVYWVLGEIGPAVLDAWGCRMPAAGMELSLSRLNALVAGAE